MTRRKTSKNKTSLLFNRYVWLVDTIYRRGKITHEEISDLWARSLLNEECEEFPLRTFHNHRHAIEQMFDINIECDKRDGYKYYIENSEDMNRGGVRNWLLNTFAVNNLINESHKLKSRILFEEIPSGQRFLTPIIEAMREELALEITYQSFWHDEPHIFKIEPYCIKIFRQRWYLVARSPDLKAIRIYALDRIQNLQITETPFKMPQEFCPETYFENAFGIIVDETIKPCTVKLKVYGKQRRYLQTLPLHPSQQEIEVKEDHSVFTYFLSPTYDFMQEILSHGNDVELLSPDWFRQKMAEVISGMNKCYSSLP